jgi:hypothetical protein
MRHKCFNHSPQLTLNRYGQERELVPVSLPRLNVADLEVEA